MLARKNYKEGSMIVYDDLIAFGPSLRTDKRICMGCFRQTAVKKNCSECSWPICSKNCDMLHYHRSLECEIFSKNRIVFNEANLKKPFHLHQYSYILILRILLMKKNEPEKWKIVVKDIHRNITFDKRNLEQNSVKFIRSECKLTQYDESTISKASHAVLKRAVKCQDPNQHMICLYPNAHCITHGCRPNAFYLILPEDNFKICIRASCAIRKGEKIYVSMIDKLTAPTVLRRMLLFTEELIDCECVRCLDPSELNTNMSSVKCYRCAVGYAMSVDPTDYGADWECKNCGRTVKSKTVQRLYNSVIGEIQQMERSSDLEERLPLCKAIIEKYKNKLHPSHGFIIHMKMVSLMSQFNNPFEINLPDEIIIEELNAAKDIMKVLDVITPGYSLHRTQIVCIIYKLMTTLLLNRKRQRNVTPQVLKNGLLETIKYGKLLCKTLKMFNISQTNMDSSFIRTNVDEFIRKYKLDYNRTVRNAANRNNNIWNIDRFNF